MLIVVTDVMTTLAEVIFRAIRDSDMTSPEALLTTSTAVVETLVTTTDISFFFQDYSHPDHQIIRSTLNPVFKPFTEKQQQQLQLLLVIVHVTSYVLRKNAAK